MKTFIAAMALVVALPAAANAQAAQPAHAQEHGDHKGTDHKDHKGCCEHKKADGTPMNCCKEAKDGKAMACCAKHEKAGEHAGHGMGKH